MIIRLIPRVCDDAGITDPEKCKVILDYCNPNDFNDTCALKMVGQAIINPDNFSGIQAVNDKVYEAVVDTFGWNIHDAETPAHFLFDLVRSLF